MIQLDRSIPEYMSFPSGFGEIQSMLLEFSGRLITTIDGNENMDGVKLFIDGLNR